MKQDPDYLIVREILKRGNAPGLLSEWFAGMKAWAEANSGPDAEALRIWLDIAKPRPFYTAGELCGFWPALRLSLGLSKILSPKPVANRLHNVLQFHGLPLLKNTDGTNFFRGLGSYFIVEHCHRWRDTEMSWYQLNEILNGGELP